MHCVGVVRNTAQGSPGKARLYDPARTSIFTCQKFVSLKIVVNVLFGINGVFPKDLGPMLFQG